MKQGEVWAGRRGGGGRGVLVQAACREGLGWRFGGEGTHPEHVFHACDAGRVEAQRLVELLRVLSSRKDGT